MKKILLGFIIIGMSLLITGCGNDNKTIEEVEEQEETEEKNPEKDKYTEETYKAMCEEIDFETIARNPDANIGKKYYGSGEIVQIVEEDGEFASFRMSITPVMNYDNTEVSYYDDTIMAYTYSYNMNNRLLEGDIIEFWGMAEGDYTYETIFGAEVTVPLFQIDYFNLK